MISYICKINQDIYNKKNKEMKHIKIFEDFSGMGMGTGAGFNGGESLLEPNYITRPGDIVICFGGEDGAYVRVDKENYLNTPEFNEAVEYYQEYYGVDPFIFKEPGIEYIIQYDSDFVIADASELTDCFALYDTNDPSNELHGDQSSDEKLLGFNLPEPGKWFHMHVTYGIAKYDNVPGKNF